MFGARVEARTRPGDGVLERLFHLSEWGTSVSREVVAGLTTFLVMAYIIAVNPLILNLGGNGLPIREVATVTCLVAGVMTIIMGLATNRAIALAPGMGINAIVAFSLVGQMGLTFPQAMGVIVAEGILVFVLVRIGWREMVMRAVPLALKKAIAVGIGLFILTIGVNDAGLLNYSAGIPSLNPLNTWSVFVLAVGLVVTLVLMARRVRGSLLLGIVAATVTAHLVPGNIAHWPDKPFAGPDFSLLGDFSFGFIGELGFLLAILTVFSLMMTDFFDTMGTLVGVGSKAGYLDQDGNFPNAQRALEVDALAAVAGGAASSSSATSYIESVAGVEAGGRTGLVSVVVGVLFLALLPFVAVIQAVPLVATAPALIVVGILMLSVLAADPKRPNEQIRWDDLEQAVPVALTMLIMPLTYNIANGIGIGFVTWVLLKVARGKVKEVHPALYIVAGAFLLYFLRWALFDAQF